MDSVESEIPSMLFTPDDDIKVEKRSINNLLVFTSLLITYNGVFIICLVTSYWSDKIPGLIIFMPILAFIQTAYMT